MGKYKCKGGFIITYGKACPECGATGKDRCRRAPDWKAKFESLQAKLDKAEKRSQFWKDNHIAGNVVIAELEAKLEKANDQLKQFVWSESNPEEYVNALAEALAKLEASEESHRKDNFEKSRTNTAWVQRATKAEAKLDAVGKLLKAAKCPDNCKDGYSDIVYGDNLHIDHFASTECQFCKNRSKALS
jgi:DNA repair exonuclease SbcCD ATPase subunit